MTLRSTYYYFLSFHKSLDAEGLPNFGLRVDTQSFPALQAKAMAAMAAVYALLAFLSAAASSIVLDGQESREDYIMDTAFLLVVAVLLIIFAYCSKVLLMKVCSCCCFISGPNYVQNKSTQTCETTAGYEESVQHLYQENHSLRLLNRRLQNMIRGNGKVSETVYVTKQGEVWHSSEDCAQCRTAGNVSKKRPCKLCTGQQVHITLM